MKILVTGAKGFVGRNLCATLYNIKDGKDRTRPDLKIEEVFEYDIDSEKEAVSPVHPSLGERLRVGELCSGMGKGAGFPVLDEYCAKADFVFNLAGVNRPKDTEDFMQGNFGFASTLLDTLKKHGNRCPVMLSSSQQASLTGRFGNSDYGRSKKAGEDLFLQYEKEAGAKVLIYRFPNLFGKWCRPNYNSAVATFCHNIANGLPIQVNDPNVELELLYIDDLISEMLDALEGKEHRCEFDGLDVIPRDRNSPQQDVISMDRNYNNYNNFCQTGRYCYCPVTHKVTLGRIVELLRQFADQPKTLLIPEIPSGSFEKKLYSTYLSYLPKEKVAFPLKMNVDDRGSFTELIHTLNCGQVSVNISRPGVTKGQHWHNTKWEFFIVVSGHALIQERPITPPSEGPGEALEFEVSGDNIQCVHMLPGYTHNIINLSDTENLVTMMWANELFDPSHPDTFFEKV